MSGGSYDYFYSKLEDMASSIREDGGCPGPDGCAPPSLRRAFKAHLMLVAKACRAIEWNDSCDGDSHERELIAACLPAGAELKEATARGERVMAELADVISRAKGNP